MSSVSRVRVAERCPTLYLCTTRLTFVVPFEQLWLPYVVLAEALVSPVYTRTSPFGTARALRSTASPQADPGSKWQDPSQPSPGVVLPSSHVSRGSSLPSPHTPSAMQPGEQPSPAAEL